MFAQGLSCQHVCWPLGLLSKIKGEMCSAGYTQATYSMWTQYSMHTQCLQWVHTGYTQHVYTQAIHSMCTQRLHWAHTGYTQHAYTMLLMDTQGHI